jgi:hypothetical protein
MCHDPPYRLLDEHVVAQTPFEQLRARQHPVELRIR